MLWSHTEKSKVILCVNQNRMYTVVFIHEEQGTVITIIIVSIYCQITNLWLCLRLRVSS